MGENEEDYTKETKSIIEKHDARENELIQILLDLQKSFDWIPPEFMKMVSEELEIPISRVFRVGSFYKGMSLKPMGEHVVQVCMGTACSVRGAERILDKAQTHLGIEGEGTTSDLKFTLQRVNCLGCCAMGPVMVVDEDYHGRLTTGDVEEVLESYE